MKKKLSIIFCILLSFSIFSQEFIKDLEIPICLESHSDVEDHQIIRHKYYTICYRESYEQAEYSAYVLTKDKLIKNGKRKDNFKLDPLVETKSASAKDYSGTNYDKGHLTPAADMSFSQEAIDETFYMSNMSPQHYSFNRGVWKNLEEQIRAWTNVFDVLYIVSGPVLDKTKSEYQHIGINRVSVPFFYYKAILAISLENDKMTNIEAFGFILPNTDSESFWSYLVPIDKIEELTNLDLFSLLDDELENDIESKIPKKRY